MTDMPWVTMAGEVFLDFLARAKQGETPGALFAEFYANSEVEYVPPSEEPA